MMLVIVLILGILTSIMLKLNKSLSNRGSVSSDKSLEEIATIIKLQREEAERIKQEDEMILYAKNKRKDLPTPAPLVNGNQSERPVNIRSSDMVPYGLSNMDKEILEMFYNEH